MDVLCAALVVFVPSPRSPDRTNLEARLMNTNLTTQAARVCGKSTLRWMLACVAGLMLITPASAAYPPAGNDTTTTPGTFTFAITGVGTDTVNLNGPSTVQRQNPCLGCGPGGRTTIQTEMIAMNLS